MDNMNLPPLKDIIQNYGLLKNKSFSKHLGQNFLLDMNITRKICALVKNMESSVILEVGPGPGGLTRAILERNPQHLYAIEMDPACVLAQSELTKHYPNYTVIENNALNVDISPLQDARPDYAFHIIANLPYNVGTELLVRWLHCDNISSMTLMFQKEVADRILAIPNTKDYGRLSILSQYTSTVNRFFNLPPTAFTPAPKVESTVVHIQPKSLTKDEKKLLPTLETITKCAFNQRRKMLRVSLKPVMSKDQMAALDFDFTQRAEDLSVDDFVFLAKHI